MKTVAVALKEEVKVGEKKKISIDGKTILLVNLNGIYYAVDNRCPHMGGSLYEGNLVGNNIVCPKHGSIFDLTNGEVVKSGKLFFMNVKVNNIKSYKVLVDGDEIKVELDD